MNIHHIINDSRINLIELYICPEEVRADDHKICVGRSTAVSLNMRSSIPYSVQNLKIYHYRDLTYIYDLDNDGQRTIRKLAQKEDFTCGRNIYCVASIEEVIPTHRFPSTQDITHTEVIKRKSYRLNNRMYFIHDEDDTGMHYYYFRYQHSDNVDIRKMQADFDRAFKQIRSQFR